MLKIKYFEPLKNKIEVLAVFKQHPEMFSMYDLASLEKSLNERSNDENIKLVVEDDTGICGFIHCILPEDSYATWEIQWIVIMKHKQRTGIGTQLLAQLLKILRENDIDKVIVNTQGDVAGLSARNFYIKNGFELMCALPDYYDESCPKVMYFKYI